MNLKNRFDNRMWSILLSNNRPNTGQFHVGRYYYMNTTSSTVNQNPPAHHPLDDSYYSVVDEPQLKLIYGFTLVTISSVGTRSHTQVGRKVGR